MSRLATRRLIDAAATLDPAERALLNLWVNRGLDDGRLAQLTGMDVQAVEARRARIVERLGDELGLPPATVGDALAQIAATTGESVQWSPNGGAASPISTNGASPAVGDASPAEPEPTVSETPTGEPEPTVNETPTGEPEPAGDRRRGVWIAICSLFLILIGASIVALATSGGSKPRAAAAKPARAYTYTASTPAASAPAAPAPAATNPVTTTPTKARIPNRSGGGPLALPLAALPGGLARARGSVQLTGPTRHLRLRLRVRGLPPPHEGHYEVWLYNSVVNSQPLGRLRAGVHVATYRLPSGGRRYRWIDISFQPLGVIYHSGESKLRASNPEHTTKARLGKRSARDRHKLQRTARVGNRRQVRRTTKSSGRHHLRQATNGSSNAKRSK